MSTDRRNPTVEIDREIYEKIQNLAKEDKKKIKPFINEILNQFIENGPFTKEVQKELISRLEKIEMKEYGGVWPDYGKKNTNKKSKNEN